MSMEHVDASKDGQEKVVTKVLLIINYRITDYGTWT